MGAWRGGVGGVGVSKHDERTGIPAKFASKGNRSEAVLLTCLTPYRWAKPAHKRVSPAETTRLIRDGQKRGGGEGVWRWGKREIIYLSLHCHHQYDSCIKTGSDESHFNVSVGSDGQSHKTVSTDHNLFGEKGEPKWYRTEVLPLTSLTARPNRRRPVEALAHLNA